jgi:hypothetical protein
MKDNLSTIYNEASNKWAYDNKGKGIVCLCDPLDRIKFLVMIIDNMISKNNNCTFWIITSDMTEKLDLTYALENESNNQELIKDAIACARVTIFTRDYAENYKYGSDFKRDIIITLNTTVFNKINNIINACTFRFKLAIMTDTPINPDLAKAVHDFSNVVYRINSNQLQHIAVSSPVKEYQLPCYLTDDDKQKYDEYTKFINDSITIFGNFDAIEECKFGNKTSNISAEEIRRTIAISNGWSVQMDMNDPMAKAIDDMYNPNALLERANNVYNIIRLRTTLISENIVKLQEIYNIVNENKGKKILIISKSSIFAEKIKNYINDNIEYSGKSVPVNGDIFATKLKFLKYPYCLGFHSEMPPVPKTDKDGKQLRYSAKSQKAGQPIYMAEKAQKSFNLGLFNDGYTKVLSANNAIDKSLEGEIDILILTSTLCSSVRDIKYRLPNLVFSSIPNEVYKVYCANTIEQNKLEKEVRNKEDEIVKNCENNISIGDF